MSLVVVPRGNGKEGDYKLICQGAKAGLSVIRKELSRKKHSFSISKMQ